MLSIIFIILGYPVFLHRHGFWKAWLIAGSGVFFIWVTYVIRAILWYSDGCDREPGSSE
ncbi:hypothetical protein JXO59_00420 [candidate division KSB1 bacterium]|nr:hypothetical protein [candidate division KSB1 bacterium]